MSDESNQGTPVPTTVSDKKPRARKPRAATQVAYIGVWVDYMPGEEAEHRKAFVVFAGPLRTQAAIDEACAALPDGEYRLLPGVNAERPIVKRTERKAIVSIGKPE
jgi:hypothetical protein